MAGQIAIPAGDVLPERITKEAPVRVAAGSSAVIAARLERLPMTGFQRNIFLIIATAWFFDTIDLGSLTFLLGSIKSV